MNNSKNKLTINTSQSDDRRRIYYTKAQTISGLVTKGKEWMFTDNTEYIGQYHKYTTGEVFTEPSYVKGKSRKLIPYVDFEKIISTSTDIDLNMELNSEYDTVKSIDINKTTYLNPDTNKPKDSDFISGYVLRYFVFKINDHQLVELNEDDYSKVGSDDGFTDILWHKFEMRWKISGPDYDIIDKAGNITQSGIIDTNIRTVALLSEKYPTLMDYITDYREFSKF